MNKYLLNTLVQTILSTLGDTRGIDSVLTVITCFKRKIVVKIYDEEKIDFCKPGDSQFKTNMHEACDNTMNFSIKHAVLKIPCSGQEWEKGRI